jgi:hypothetical protein
LTQEVPLQIEVINPRRAPRVAHRCNVELRDRFASWKAETEDLGPGGCKVASPRLTVPGREVQLHIRCDAIGRVIHATGRVVWSRYQTPSRLGIEFTVNPAERDWFDALVGADPAAAAMARRHPERLPLTATLRLGEPPPVPLELSASEVAVLRRIGDGLTVEALGRDLGNAFERVRGAVFDLVSRRLLVLSRHEAVPGARWAEPLRRAEAALAAGGIALPADSAGVGPEAAGGRRAEAQRLFDEGIAHVGSGRMELAVALLREAQRHAPGDQRIAGALQRLAPWATAAAADLASGRKPS